MEGSGHIALSILAGILQIVMLPLVAPLVTGIIRKIKALLQNREGASVFQPYRDIGKLFHKDEVISPDASWVFRFTPYLLFSTTVVAGISIPLITTVRVFGFTGDFLTLVYTLALGVFFLALAGMDTGSSFGGFGSSREMTIAALSEGGIVFSILTLAIAARTTNLSSMAAAVELLPLPSLIPVVLAFSGFLIAMLAETGRFPFDNPATHLELTMIHEAMILEYSGRKLALIEWASSIRLVLFISLGVNLFFPWGLASSVTFPLLAVSTVLYLFKVFVFCLLIAGIETGMAKLRFFRLPDLLFTSFILSAIAIGLLV